jgi:hypothetical protein
LCFHVIAKGHSRCHIGDGTRIEMVVQRSGTKRTSCSLRTRPFGRHPRIRFTEPAPVLRS